MINWDDYPNFSRIELQCSHTSNCEIHPAILELLQSMRDEYGKPIFVSSGYRDPSHPVESIKDKPGEHTYGLAVDLICYGHQTLEYLKMAQDRGVTRLGVFQRGRASGRFIHLGLGDKLSNQFQTAVWTY